MIFKGSGIKNHTRLSCSMLITTLIVSFGNPVRLRHTNRNPTPTLTQTHTLT